MAKATFAAGCFWGVEATFRQLPGVTGTRVGYTGGNSKNPTYHKMGNHTESIQITYNPAVMKYEQLLEVFWKSHDSSRAVGSCQYRNAVFFHNSEQERVARSTAPTGNATAIESFGFWTDAEEYHQDYVKKNGGH